MRPSLIMVRLSLKEGGESIIELVLRFIHIFYSAIKEKWFLIEAT